MHFFLLKKKNFPFLSLSFQYNLIVRTIQYPASEELIRNKKQQKLDEQEQGA